MDVQIIPSAGLSKIQLHLPFIVKSFLTTYYELAPNASLLAGKSQRPKLMDE